MNTNFTVVGLTRLGINPKSAAPEAYALIPLVHLNCKRINRRYFNNQYTVVGKSNDCVGRYMQSFKLRDLQIPCQTLQKICISRHTDRGTNIKNTIGCFIFLSGAMVKKLQPSGS